MIYRLFRLSFVLAALSFARISSGAQDSMIPDGSAMASCKDGQRLLLNPLVARESVSVPNRDAVFATALNCVGLESKMGLPALTLRDVARDENYQAVFKIASQTPFSIKNLGLWVHLATNANVARVGLQIVDHEGEVFSFLRPAGWQGWKWVEINLFDNELKPSFPQPTNASRINLPVSEIDFIWQAKTKGQTAISVNGLAAIAQTVPAPEPCSCDIVCPIEGYPNLPFHGELLIHNFGDQPLDLDTTLSLQDNPLLYDKPLINPLLGNNRALGKKCWLEIDGKRIEDPTLTDVDSDTAFSSPWINNHYTEAFQYVDLGQERKVIHMDYQNGDANWIHQVDVCVSLNGTNYTPVDGLQELDLHQRWGLQSFPVKEPFPARYLRLRYHDTSGKRDPIIRTIAELFVYDGPGSDYVGIPKIGDLVAQQKSHVTVAPRTFALVPMVSSAPLPTGSYYFGVAVRGNFGTRLFTANHFVRSSEEVAMRPQSRFGMNAAGVMNVPLLKEMGFAWIRFENMKWGFFNTSPNAFLLNGTAARSNVPFDDYMQAYHDAGMSVLPYIFQTPAWASSAPQGTKRNIGGYPPTDYNDYGKAVFEATARYGTTTHRPAELHTPDKRTGLGLITTYEIWNEPNLSAPEWGFFVAPLEKYLDLFRIGAEAVKRADPNSRVCAAVFSGLSMKDIDKLRSYKYPDGKDALDFADILSFHFYSGRQEPELASDDPNTNRSGKKSADFLTYEQALAAIADWRDDFKPDLPLWLTETGNDVGGPIGRTERFQAAKLPRDIMIALANGVEKVFLYRETGSQPVMHGGAGIIRDDGSLRPSFFTLSTLSRELDKVTSVRTSRLITSDPRVWLYRWRSGQDYVVTAWTPVDSAPLGLDLGKCHVVDSFGFSQDMTVNKAFKLSIFPIYITQITDPAPLDTLATEAVAREQALKNLRTAKM
jgi:hypothetical protein